MQRTLTINHVHYSAKDNKIPGASYKPYHDGISTGIGDHQYTHNTPADYVRDKFLNLQDLDTENYDDYYSVNDDLVHVQDQKGWSIIYDVTLTDFR